MVSLYALTSHCLEKYAMQRAREDQLRNWFIGFEGIRAAQGNSQMTHVIGAACHKERTSHSTDAQDSIQWRHEFLLRKFFESVSDIEQKR